MTRDEVWSFLRARARAWETGDLEAIAAGYAPDAVLIAPGGIRLEGIAALRENNARYFAVYTDIRVDLTRVVLDGDEGALEWTWSETRRADGQRGSGGGRGGVEDMDHIGSFDVAEVIHQRAGGLDSLGADAGAGGVAGLTMATVLPAPWKVKKPIRLPLASSPKGRPLSKSSTMRRVSGTYGPLVKVQ